MARGKRILNIGRASRTRVLVNRLYQEKLEQRADRYSESVVAGEENWRVTYRGFLQEISRDFPTLAQAEQWLRQIGKSREAHIHRTA